jgi:hypothetical protein
MVKATQNQQDMIDALTGRVEDLEAENIAIRDILSKI